MEAQLTQAVMQLSELQKEVRGLNAENRNLKKESAHLTDQVANLQRRVDNYQRENEVLDEDNKQLRGEVGSGEDLQNKIRAELAGEMGNFRKSTDTTITSLRKRVTELEGELFDTKAMNNVLREQLGYDKVEEPVKKQPSFLSFPFSPTHPSSSSSSSSNPTSSSFSSSTKDSNGKISEDELASWGIGKRKRSMSSKERENEGEDETKNSNPKKGVNSNKPPSAFRSSNINNNNKPFNQLKLERKDTEPEEEVKSPEPSNGEEDGFFGGMMGFIFGSKKKSTFQPPKKRKRMDSL